MRPYSPDFKSKVLAYAKGHSVAEVAQKFKLANNTVRNWNNNSDMVVPTEEKEAHEPAPINGSDSDLMTTKQAAEFLGVDKTRIYHLVKAGKLPMPTTKIGESNAYPREAVESYGSGRRFVQRPQNKNSDRDKVIVVTERDKVLVTMGYQKGYAQGLKRGYDDAMADLELAQLRGEA